MRISLLALSLAILIETAASQKYSCELGSESCICQILNRTKLTISCTSKQSYPSQLPSEFGSLNKSFQYYIEYANKNISTIENNSSLSQNNGLVVVNLDLSKNGIIVIEPAAFQNLQVSTIDVTRNKLSKLDFLTWLCSLTIIYLGENQIAYLDSRWFKCMSELKYLHLQSNSITAIESGTFADLKKLSRIDLRSNLITVINSEAFSGLTDLYELCLDSNQLVTIKSRAFKNSTLLGYYNSYCNFGIGNQNIENLEELWSFGSMSYRNSLDLSNNRLSSLVDKTFSGMEELQNLSLSNNYLRHLAANAFDTSQRLALLNLSSNYLTRINRTTFAKLQALAFLYLDQNLIETIEPYSFISFSRSLLELDLHSNMIGFIKRAFFVNMTALQRLCMSYNQISSIETRSFDSMTRLTDLMLDHNCIFRIDVSLLRNLVLLQILSFENNVISKLQSNVFSNLTQLVTLDLSYNNIDWIESNVFKNLKRLVTLDLSNNRLDVLINSQVFDGLVSLKTLDLSSNKFSKLRFDYISISLRTTLESLRLDSNLPKSVVSYTVQTFSKLRIVDISSNNNLKDASSLMLNLGTCVTCQYEISLRNMSTEFIKSFVQYLSKYSKTSQISKLDLSYNNLEGLVELMPLKAMSNTLTRLYMRECNISQSISQFSFLNSLVEIDLSDNPIVSLKRVFSNNSQVKIVSFSNTGISSIQSGVDLSSFLLLTRLDLSWNRIQVIRANDFVNNPDLRWLDLSYNNIKYIENRSFIQQPKFDFIDLSFNQLKTIQKDLWPVLPTVSSLELRLNNNGLTEFAYATNFFSFLNLQDNEFNSVPSDVKVMGKFTLATLLMDRNKLTSIKKSYFVSMKFVTCLSLSNNQIAEIEDDSFKDCKSLNDIDLSINMISKIGSNAFTGLSAVNYLNLSSNLIGYLQQDLFIYLKNLVSVDLNNNRIKHIEDQVFINLNHVQTVKLNSLEMANLTNSTLKGLDSIRDIAINSLQMNTITNIHTLIETFPRVLRQQNDLYSWYQSINIAFNEPTKNQRYCSMVLYFAGRNFQINLKTDLDVEAYMIACKSSTLRDLDYSHFGFIL